MIYRVFAWKTAKITLNFYKKQKHKVSLMIFNFIIEFLRSRIDNFINSVDILTLIKKLFKQFFSKDIIILNVNKSQQWLNINIV